MNFEFSSAYPGDQASLDIFKDKWFSSMPAESGLAAGNLDHFNDARVPWADGILKLKGKRILELGPFEAYNTYQFEKAGAVHVTAIESSVENFLKCLVVKNVFDLNAKFLHGDFEIYEPDVLYDIVWASGVLYHLVKPVEFLQRMLPWSNNVFLWTQYYDASVLGPTHGGSANFNPANDKVVRFRDRDIRLHWRSYMEQTNATNFSGGSEQYSYWMELDDIKYVFSEMGFGNITMGIDNPNHPPGPACFFVAQR